MAWASTVAVVVPSPATSEGFDATSFTIWAPMFSNLFSSSISFATVTPSFVIVGDPKLFSMTTFRPFGPSVTATASARVWTPRRMASRASWWNAISFAGIVGLLYKRDNDLDALSAAGAWQSAPAAANITVVSERSSAPRAALTSGPATAYVERRMSDAADRLAEAQRLVDEAAERFDAADAAG